MGRRWLKFIRFHKGTQMTQMLMIIGLKNNGTQMTQILMINYYLKKIELTVKCKLIDVK